MIPKRPTKPQSSRKLLLLLFLLLLVGLGVVYKDRWNIYDWYKLRGYTAPTNVAQLATDDTMTPYARKVFYVNRPALEGKVDFKQCSSKGEQTIVLGCYHGFQNGIFVLTVTDPRLNGVEQVTAAHEMLHAAYDRLSSKERAAIDSELRDYYNHGLSDERVRQTIEAYRSSEPTELVNEMHSIFGTEVAGLPAPLEQYYKRYFTDRSKITSFAAQYQAEFTSRQDAISAYDAQVAALIKQIKADDVILDAQKADIANKQKSIDAQNAAIEVQRAQLNEYRSQGDTASYNAGVAGYNSAAQSFNTQLSQLTSQIDSYNALVATRNGLADQAEAIEKQRNSLAQETKQLTDEIDSKVAPISTK